MDTRKGWRYWRNLGYFVVVLLALAAVGLVVGVSWTQADAFRHPHRPLPTETPTEGERRVVGFFDAALLNR
jgi:hypothetical protein